MYIVVCIQVIYTRCHDRLNDHISRNVHVDTHLNTFNKCQKTPTKNQVVVFDVGELDVESSVRTLMGRTARTES